MATGECLIGYKKNILEEFLKSKDGQEFIHQQNCLQIVKQFQNNVPQHNIFFEYLIV